MLLGLRPWSMDTVSARLWDTVHVTGTQSTLLVDFVHGPATQSTLLEHSLQLSSTVHGRVIQSTQFKDSV